MKPNKIGICILGLTLVAYAILGFFNIEVWIKLEGWRLLNNTEISILALVGTILIVISSRKDS